jgi:putative transposase
MEVLVMPWKEIDVMDQKKTFVIKAFDRNINFTELCREFGISTKTGYKYKARFLEGGFPALEELSRETKINAKKLPDKIKYELIAIKIKRPTWGPSKILSIYHSRHPRLTPPARSTVERILMEVGLHKRRKRYRFQTVSRIQNRIQPKQPNDVWTVDFKGWWYTPLKEKCEPLTVRDEFSKYILSIKVLEKGNISSVKSEFQRLFKRFGLPLVIRSDNGIPFASEMNSLGLTKLSVWWVSLGIILDRIDKGKPYQNGGHERMHRDMKNELEGQIDGNLLEHQRVFDEWRKDFNTERPHEALKMKTPASVYVKSEREYEPEIDRIEYPRGYKSRIVNDRGFINLKGHRVFIGNPFAGFNIGIKRLKTGNFEVKFDYLYIGMIDEKTFLFNAQNRIIKSKVS